MKGGNKYIKVTSKPMQKIYKTKEKIMLFYKNYNENYISESKILEVIQKESMEYCDGFIFKVAESDNGVFIESYSITQSELHIEKPKKRFKDRYIMITGAEQAKHDCRMKVSKRGCDIKENNKNDYISIHRQDKDSLKITGDTKNIDMNSKELKCYEDLFKRNENLIRFITQNKINKQVANDAFIHDEDLRFKKYKVERSKVDGSAEIYDENNKFIKRVDINGDEI